MLLQILDLFMLKRRFLEGTFIVEYSTCMHRAINHYGISKLWFGFEIGMLYQISILKFPNLPNYYALELEIIFLFFSVKIILVPLSQVDTHKKDICIRDPSCYHICAWQKT